MKYTHYAPKAPLKLVEGGIEALRRVVNQSKGEGLHVGAFLYRGDGDKTDTLAETEVGADVLLYCGENGDVESIGRELYGMLRDFDQTKVDVIYGCILPSDLKEGLGMAVMNRMLKAASEVIGS